jgi:hypothetical protein
MSDQPDQPRPDLILWDMFWRDAIPAVKGLMVPFIRRQREGMKTLTKAETTAVVNMVRSGPKWVVTSWNACAISASASGACRTSRVLSWSLGGGIRRADDPAWGLCPRGRYVLLRCTGAWHGRHQPVSFHVSCGTPSIGTLATARGPGP